MEAVIKKQDEAKCFQEVALLIGVRQEWGGLRLLSSRDFPELCAPIGLI